MRRALVRPRQQCLVNKIGARNKRPRFGRLAGVRETRMLTGLFASRERAGNTS